MSNNAKVGGILSIVAGAIGALWAAVVLFFVLLISVAAVSGPSYDSRYYAAPPGDAVALFVVFVVGFGVLFAAVPVLAIVGGVFALKRKHWGWALAGAIASVFIFLPCGVPAIVFVAMGKPEFASSPFAPPPALPTSPSPPPPITPAS